MSFNEGCWFYVAFCFLLLIIMYFKWLLKSLFGIFDKWCRLRKLRSLRKWRKEWEREMSTYMLRQALHNSAYIKEVYAGYTRECIGFVSMLWIDDTYVKCTGQDLQPIIRKVARLAYHHLRKG